MAFIKRSHYPSSWRATITSSVLQEQKEKRKRDLICYFPSFPTPLCLHFRSVCFLPKLSRLLQMISFTANGFFLPSLPLRQCSSRRHTTKQPPDHDPAPPNTVLLLYKQNCVMVINRRQISNGLITSETEIEDHGQHIFIQKPFKSPPHPTPCTCVFLEGPDACRPARHSQ